jgi:HEAT repeat protein
MQVEVKIDHAPALANANRRVRQHAASALGLVGDTRAVEPLIGLLRDPDDNVRANATSPLGLIGDVRAAEPLVQLGRSKKAVEQKK